MADHSGVPIVTVAMSVLNGGDYLQLSVRSIVAQTLQNWELLIFDDGSTDGAIDNLLPQKDPRIILIRDGVNKGLSARLNQAINMARGRYFARMDHDDLSHPSRLAEQVAFLDANPQTDLLATKCLTINESNQAVGSLPFACSHQEICARPWMGFPMPHPSWMGRVSWFRRHYYQDPAPYCCEDNELLLRAHETSVYHALEQQLLAYRIRSYSPWQKMWRTRKAMAAVQISYFISRRDFRLATLSCAALLLRVARDLMIGLLYRVGFPAVTVRATGKPPENPEWIDRIGC